MVTNVFIRSAAFPHVHLRMDRSPVTGFNGNGSGTVNRQYYADEGTEPGSLASYEALSSLSYQHLISPRALLSPSNRQCRAIRCSCAWMAVLEPSAASIIRKAASRRLSRETTRFFR
jgi:hypothetical protein